MVALPLNRPTGRGKKVDDGLSSIAKGPSLPQNTSFKPQSMSIGMQDREKGKDSTVQEKVTKLILKQNLHMRGDVPNEMMCAKNCKAKFWVVTILQTVEFPIFLVNIE